MKIQPRQTPVPSNELSDSLRSLLLGRREECLAWPSLDRPALIKHKICAPNQLHIFLCMSGLPLHKKDERSTLGELRVSFSNINLVRLHSVDAAIPLIYCSLQQDSIADSPLRSGSRHLRASNGPIAIIHTRNWSICAGRDESVKEVSNRLHTYGISNERFSGSLLPLVRQFGDAIKDMVALHS